MKKKKLTIGLIAFAILAFLLTLSHCSEKRNAYTNALKAAKECRWHRMNDTDYACLAGGSGEKCECGSVRKGAQ